MTRTIDQTEKRPSFPLPPQRWSLFRMLALVALAVTAASIGRVAARPTFDLRPPSVDARVAWHAASAMAFRRPQSLTLPWVEAPRA